MDRHCIGSQENFGSVVVIPADCSQTNLHDCSKYYFYLQIIQEFEPHLNCVNCFCFSADERFLYSGDGGGALRIWASADANKENWMFLKEIKEDRLMVKKLS